MANIRCCFGTPNLDEKGRLGMPKAKEIKMGKVGQRPVEIDLIESRGKDSEEMTI